MVAAASYYVATGQPATVRVYRAQEIATAVGAATSDGCDVGSISWGADEMVRGETAAHDMEEAATSATAAGMIVLAASGDEDSGKGGPTPANVDVPWSCPRVIGCGGPSRSLTTEVVWNNEPGETDGNGTGGGYSKFFRAQSWQTGAPSQQGHLIPDVAATTDPYTGYHINIDGEATMVGGTSAVAPLFSGLFASFGTKIGFISPTLWANQNAFNDITEGNNGFDSAAVGPDPCSGVGSPIGDMIAALFANMGGSSGD